MVGAVIVFLSDSMASGMPNAGASGARSDPAGWRGPQVFVIAMKLIIRQKINCFVS